VIIVSISRAHHNHKQLTFINIVKNIWPRNIIVAYSTTIAKSRDPVARSVRRTPTEAT